MEYHTQQRSGRHEAVNTNFALYLAIAQQHNAFHKRW